MTIPWRAILGLIKLRVGREEVSLANALLQCWNLRKKLRCLFGGLESGLPQALVRLPPIAPSTQCPPIVKKIFPWIWSRVCRFQRIGKVIAMARYSSLLTGSQRWSITSRYVQVKLSYIRCVLVVCTCTCMYNTWPAVKFRALRFLGKLKRTATCTSYVQYIHTIILLRRNTRLERRFI